MKKFDSPKEPVPCFEELLSDMESESELVDIRSRISRRISFRAQGESPFPNMLSPRTCTPLSDASQTFPADIESGDTSESKGRKDSWFNIPLKAKLFSPLENAFGISYAHLFDMRGKRGHIIVSHKIEISSQESDELAEKVSNDFKVPKEHVVCVKKKVMIHSHLKYFGISIIINDPLDLDSCIPILIIGRASSVESEFDFFPPFYGHSANNILCILFPKEEKVERLKRTFAEKHNLPINSFAFSLDKRKLMDTDDIVDVVEPYDLLYLVKQKPINIRLELLQCPKLRQILIIDGVTTVDTISCLKNMLIKTLSDLGTTTLNEKNICISKEEEILYDNQILNSIQDFPYHSELTLRLHLVQPRYTWYKIDTVTAMGMKIVEVVCVNQQSTAAQLRNEVAKICCCPSQALKLVTSGKTIPENKCLEEIPFLQDGCTIKASIVSKIRVNVKVISTGEQSERKVQQLQVEVYRLDTVFKLKQTVNRSLESPANIYTCVMKKKETLEESKFLRDYGIKNETEVTAYIFKERIQVMLVILKMKKRIQVFVDEPRFTFVKDLLKYVQGSGLTVVHYTQMRLVYRDNCLPMDVSLSDVDVKHGSVLVVIIAEVMNPGIIMMCPGKQGVALSMIGIVINGIIYYASSQEGVDKSRALKAIDEPVLLPRGIHLVESASLGYDDPNPVPSLVLPSHLHVADDMMKKESMEREKYIYFRREDVAAGCSIPCTLEERKVIVHRVPRMVCGSKSEGYLSEQSDSTPNRKKQKYLKRARALTSKSENNIPAAISPRENSVSESNKTQIDLNSQCPMVCSGQPSHIKVTSESASTCITVSNSSIGTGTSTYSASCNTVMQSNLGTVPHPMNFMNTGLISMQNTNGESCKGGYTATVKYFDKDNVTWCYSLREEMMQVTGSAANMGTPALINNTMLELGSAPNGHNGGTTGLLQRSSDIHGGILVECCGFTQDLLHSLASDVGVDWKKLGRKLAVAEERISAIDTDNPNIVEKCYKMLYHWCIASRCATKQQELADKLIACGLCQIAVKYFGDKVPV